MNDESERDKFIGRYMPLSETEFFDDDGEPISVAEFAERWRARNGDEAHLAAILRDLGYPDGDLIRRAPGTGIHRLH